MISIKACVIPAAGRGGGMYPLTKDIPKEMLPLGKKPAIGYVVSEAIESGLKDIIIVINKNKEIIKKYFSQNKTGKRANFHFLYQNEPRGIAEAIYLAKPLIGDNYFVLLFPDLPAIYKTPPLAQLVKIFNKLKNKSHLIAMASYPRNNHLYYAEFLLNKSNKQSFSSNKDIYKIIHLCPRAKFPGDSHHKGNQLRGAGRNIYGSHIWPHVDKCLKEIKRKEVGDPEIINSALSSGQLMLAHEIEGKIYDIGNPTGYEKAISEFR